MDRGRRGIIGSLSTSTPSPSKMISSKQRYHLHRLLLKAELM
jgi:hypothetical protein